MAEILPEIFNRSLSLETGGDRSGRDPVAIWERMAKSLDEIAANTRGLSGGTASSSRSMRASAQGTRQRRSTRDYPGNEILTGRQSAVSTGSGRQKATAGRQAGGGTGAFGSPTGGAGVSESYARARGGIRGLGPLARVASQVAATATTQAVKASEAKRGGSTPDSKAQTAQSRYQQRTDRENTARATQSLEIASGSFNLQRTEARQSQKRHKELVKAVKAASQPGLLGKAGSQLFGSRARGKDGRFIAQGGRAAARGGLLRGAGALLSKASPLALLFASMEALEGANNAELHREAFGLKEGQEASTGQRVAAAAANVLDMGGLVSGAAASLFGLDFNTADIARGLYDTATTISDFFKQLNPETLLAGAKTVMATAIDIGRHAFDGVTDFVAGLDLPGKATALVGAVGDLGSRAISSIAEFFGSIDITGTLKGAATSAWDAVKGGAGKLADGFMSLFTSDDKGGKKAFATEAGKTVETRLAQEVTQKTRGAIPEVVQTAAAASMAGTDTGLPVELSQADKQTIAGPLTSSYEVSSLLNESLEKLTSALIKDYQLREREFRLNMMLNPEAAAMLGLTDALKGFSLGGGGGGGGGAGGGTYHGSRSSVRYDPNSKLGSYFVQYESENKGVNAIGYDSGGGTSYGKYQFSSTTGGMDELLKYAAGKGGWAADFAQRMRAAGPLNTGGRTGAAVDVYNAEVAQNRELMEQLQDEFAFEKYYKSALEGLDQGFQDRIGKSRALQEVLFSSSIQHGVGGARGIFKQALAQNPNASDEDLLRAIFQLRSGKTGHLTAAEQSGVSSRYGRELAMAIQLSQSQRRVEAFQRAGAAGGQTALDAQMSMGIQEMTADAIQRGVGYKLGGKSSFSGEGIDCSGWIYETNVRLMNAINDAAGEIIYDDSAFKALREGHNNQGAAGLIKAVYDQTGQMLTNEMLNPETVRAGMMIGLDTGAKSWDGGRFQGIDHIVQTFRDELTGELMVSESRGGKGVMTSTFKDWFEKYQKSGAQMYAVDPTLLADVSKIQAKEAETVLAQAETAQAVNAQAAETVSSIQPMPFERAETVTPRPRVEEVGQIAPPTQAGTNRQLDLAGVEGLLRDILKALQTGFSQIQRVADSGSGGPNFAMDFDDAAAREVANS